ncbi:MAG: efflux RND transporter periplasmic adaptor subunit [Desulfofustis sp.]|nr:efflux RND transporter periplasmic adaptor subunit [Desulfofustis sp.]
MSAKKRLIIVVLLLAAAGAALFTSYFAGKNDQDHATLRVSGTIEVTEARLSFRIPGHLAERAFDEGEQVVAGQKIARLDNRDQLLAVDAAEADLALARAVLAELEAGSRPEEITMSRAELERARAAAESAEVRYLQTETDYRRHAALIKNGGVSQKAFEDYQAIYETARHSREEARARVTAAAAQLDLRRAGPRSEQIDQARARLNGAEKALDIARLQSAHTTIYAPFDGVVLTTSAEVGEYLNPSTPVLIIGDLRRPWLRAYINETDLGRIKLNQQVRVSTDSYPGTTYHGRISFISDQAEFTPKSVQTFEERVKLMYRVKIALENLDGELKPGMPADAWIDLKAPSTP